MKSNDQKNKKIEKIPPVPQEILKAASRGNLVVFVGAGVSRIIGCPSWKKLALLQLEELRKKGVINYFEYSKLKELDERKLLSICLKICKEKNIPQNFTFFLRGEKDLIEKYKIYEYLYDFNAIYVTTNYDDYLDQVAQIPTKKPAEISEGPPSSIPGETVTLQDKVVYKKDELLISNLDSGIVIHLHGSIKDETNLVVTIVDYLNHYAPISKAAVLLEEIFTSFTVLFIGYGLEEYEILEFMVSKSRTAKMEIKHFMLYPTFGAEIDLLEYHKQYYKDLGVVLIPYLIDEEGYEQLASVICEWAKQIGPISKSRDFFQKAKTIDGVL